MRRTRRLSGSDGMVGRRGVGVGGVVALALAVSLVGCGPSASSEATSTGPLEEAATAEVAASPAADRSGPDPAAPPSSPTPAPVPGSDGPTPARPGAAPPRPTGTVPAGRRPQVAGAGGADGRCPAATAHSHAPVRDEVERSIPRWPATACGAPGVDRGWRAPDHFIHWPADGSVVLFTQGGGIYAMAADGSRVWQVAEPRPWSDTG